jgi:hypothetical protein
MRAFHGCISGIEWYLCEAAYQHLLAHDFRAASCGTCGMTSRDGKDCTEIIAFV